MVTGNTSDAAASNFEDSSSQTFSDAQSDLQATKSAAEIGDSTLEENPIFVVGIGASAGGLRALEEFFAHMPQDSGAAFVIIQHLSPDHKSLMKELLGRCTQMAIYRVEDGMALAANAIYLIPPGQNLVVTNRHLRLTKQDRLHRHQLNFPIDVFFESLARDCPEQAIAIILSGTGSDGSRGIQAVHEAGGITLVQDPADAEFDGMPQSALATGIIDRSLAIAELTQLVYDLVRNPSGCRTLQRVDPFVHIQEPQLQQILRLLATYDDIDFSQYKTTTLSRRIQRRCLIAGFQDFDNYLGILETSPEERQALKSDLLISVTQFFRDPQAWEFLTTEILPPLIDNMSAQDPLRVWVTACATGEEAYSMAILIHEVAITRGKPVHAKIFATDLNRQCLEQAAQGGYPLAIADSVSESRLQRYFVRKGETYEIIRSIREMIVFAPHNLIKDAGFSRMHLVSCRNVLIYLQVPLQQQVLRRLHFSLRPQGILFLGESENLGELEGEFSVRDRRLKMYEKRRSVRLIKGLPQPRTSLPATIVPEAAFPLTSTRLHLDEGIRLQEAMRLLISDLQGCCLIVDEFGNVIHAFGERADILPLPNGPVSREATKMVALPLQLPLSTAFSHARKTKGFVHYSAIKLPSKSGDLVFRIQVLFHEANKQIDNFFIVFIQPEEFTLAASQELNLEDLEQATAQRIFELESELQRTRESLQATIEELETTNEEQQATNEELIASNEELQSTNEELQSLNEELYTVNAEYQAKIQELTELNNDIDNLLESTEIGVIFLDQELCVRKFTPAATQVFALVQADIGRPINHLAHRLETTNLYQQLRQVLVTERSIEEDVKLIDVEQCLLMRINPYKLDNQQVDGLVLTFIDITEIQKAQTALAENSALLETVLNSTPDSIFVKDLSGYYRLVNEAALRAFDRSDEEVIGANDLSLFPATKAQTIMIDDQEVLKAGKTVTYENRTQTSTGETVYHLTTKAIFRDREGNPLGLVGFERDITGLKQAQANLQQSNQDLQQEIVQRQTALSALQESEERFRSTFEQAAVGIAHIAPDGSFLRINQRFADIAGYAKDEMLNKTFQEVTPTEDLEATLDLFNQLLVGDIPTYTTAKRFIRKNQDLVWVESTVSLVQQSSTESCYFIYVIKDITIQKNLELERDRVLQELAHEKELAQVTLHSIGDAVITTDAEARIQYCNPVAEQLTGWPAAAIHGRPLQEVVTLLNANTREPAPNLVATVLAGAQTVTNVTAAENLILRSRDGLEFTISNAASAIRDHEGHLLGVVAVFRDVTEAHTLSQQLSWQACHDPLTGLLNRRQFERSLNHVLEGIRMDDRQEHVLCYLDLDQFKVVNDTCGHLAGDELLRQVATLLKGCVRASDGLARLGGDEFGVLLQNCPLSRAKIIANTLREVIQDFQFGWEQRTFRIGVSIGLVAINEDTSSLTSVMSAADAACYAAKERGRNRVYIYQPDDAEVTRQRSEREWSVRIRNALEHDQFCLYQQPIVPAQGIAHENSVHYEVLLRMIDDEGNLIPPTAFIPAAERYDLMPEIDRWVVQEFLHHVVAQPPADMASATYMVNLSGASLTDDAYLGFLQTELRNHPAIAQQICFEITETAVVSNLAEAADFIIEMQKLGCQFALDDFGSGMSSFGYLKTLPVNYIKIDGRFVQDITTDPTARAIVESINHIGHVMGLRTIAESVENDAIQCCLQEIGVDCLQGYGITRPQPLEHSEDEPATLKQETQP